MIWETYAYYRFTIYSLDFKVEKKFELVGVLAMYCVCVCVYVCFMIFIQAS